MKRCALLPPALALTLLLNGCGVGKGIYANYRAIEELQTVQTLGLDQGENGKTVALAGMSSAGEDPSPILRHSGGSILLAIRALEDYTGRGQLFFAHTRYVLLGRSQAASGIGPLLDYTERDPLTRMGAGLFVLKNGMVEDLLTEIGDGNQITDILDSVRRNTEIFGGSQVTDLRSTAVALSEYGAALVCALAARPTEDSVLSEGPTALPIPDGFGILKDGALVDFLPHDRAESAGFLLGHPGTVSRSFPVAGGGSVTVELRGAGADFRPGRENGVPVMDIRLSLSAVLAEADRVTLPVTEGTATRALEADISAQIEAELRQTLELSKALDADFLALARQLRLNGEVPAADWLRAVSFRVRVDTVIDNSNDLHEPVGTGGQNT